MLRLIADRCTQCLLAHRVIQGNEASIYIYGFELFWSLVLNIVSILFIGVLLDRFTLSIAFLLFFVPIRITAGGYHASSFRMCFIFSNIIAAACILFSGQLWIYRSVHMDMVLFLSYMACIIFIEKNSPVVSSKFPLKAERIIKNRRYTRIIIGIEVLVLAVSRGVFNSRIVYTAIVTSCVVAAMIFLGKEGE